MFPDTVGPDGGNAEAVAAEAATQMTASKTVVGMLRRTKRSGSVSYARFFFDRKQKNAVPAQFFKPRTPRSRIGRGIVNASRKSLYLRQLTTHAPDRFRPSILE